MVLTEEEVKLAADAIDRMHTAIVDLMHVFKEEMFK